MMGGDETAQTEQAERQKEALEKDQLLDSPEEEPGKLAGFYEHIAAAG